jgi:hypothetical protein
MEKVTEIDTLETDSNAFEVLVRCKEMANSIDLANIILDTTCIDEKEMLIRLIESIRNLELEVIEVQVPFIPEVQA